MKIRWILLAFLFVAMATGALWADVALSPREVDAIVLGPRPPIDRATTQKIMEDARKLRSAAVLVTVGDREVLGYGDIDDPLDVRSIRKSLLSLAIGQLVKAGKLDLDASLADLGIDDRDFALDDTEKRATVAQLMAGLSGVYHVAAREMRSEAKYRPERGEYAPGAFWYYNNWDFNALETIAARAAGDSDYCQTFARMVAPHLGISNPAERCEVQAEDVSVYPAHPLSLSSRELARFANLLLAEAKSPRLLPAGWVAWSVEPVSDFHFIPDSKFNYGRLFWSIDPWAGTGNQTFMMRGAGSIYVWAIPGRDLVIVHHVRTTPLVLRNKLGLIPDDNDAWTFGGRIASAILRGRYDAETLY